MIKSYEEFNLYENKDYLPIIYSKKNINFRYINDAKYRVYLNNFKEKINLTILINFDPNWNLYLVKNPSSDWCKPIKFYKESNTTECESTQKFFEGEELSYLWKKPIFDDTHQLVFDYANGWTIDPQYIKDHYSKDYYTVNPDGSLNIELVIYYKPQSYFLYWNYYFWFNIDRMYYLSHL